MCATNLNIFQETLEKDLTRLIDEIQRETDKLNTYAEDNPDPYDLADKSFQQEITAGHLRHLKRKMKKVESALKRIKDHTYGICVRCGQPINPERLEAMPYVTLCVKCKKGQERPR